MSRQQRRAQQRKAVKSIKKTASVPTTATAMHGVQSFSFDDLNERQQKGCELWRRSQQQNGLVLFGNDDTLTVWFSQNDPNRAYHINRDLRNRRGTLVVSYSCDCPDSIKYGRIDCKHVFAEKLRRGEVVVSSPPRKKSGTAVKKATRRPARKRFAHDGRTLKTARKTASRKMPTRIPELALSLAQGFERLASGIVIPIRPQKYKGGRKGSPLSARAAALVLKVAAGLSASEMMPHFQRYVQERKLHLKGVPDENTFSDWMNDERLTPILKEMLRQSAFPFRRREVGAIIDSSKVSQLMTAHAKEVEYGNHDKRPNADWMKAHVVCGVETLVVMDVLFSGVLGGGTHDSNFLRPLVDAAVQNFPLEFVLADKAYLSEDVPQWLAERGIRAVIPIKKGWFRDERKLYNEALLNLVQWHDANNNRDFHEVYRLRSKIECLFSVLKRMAGGYCWSRGRKRTIRNANDPCVAWINETICKFIYVNLRTTVNLEEETGVTIDYTVSSRHFPEPDEPLLKKRAA